MVAVLTTSEALVNNTINLNEGFGKHDLIIFENFLNSKKEMNRSIRKKLKKEGILYDFKPLTNIEFARLIVSVEQSEGDNFYCKGFGKKVRAVIYNNFKELNGL